ncbi:diaminopimelate epimerase [Spirosomataceae bacterium TFI 002]|nr:diaminopimelate epimerase [Spirosomataceae bacterium TFI 002]
MKFYKYQGTGNDFVMIDNRDNSISLSQKDIAKLCHRRFGVGADGLIFLTLEDGYDFRMIYHNADGAEGSMCGNGGRCTVKFAHDLGLFTKETRFIAVDGLHEAEVLSDGTVSLGMVDVKELESQNGDYFCNTGSPHVVQFVENVSDFDVFGEGAAIRNSDFWQQKGGTNVNFLEQKGKQEISVRTFERGVEDETYSCGTGVTACALIINSVKEMNSPIKVTTLGGNLSISFDKIGKGYQNIKLIGPAMMVFEGFLVN